MLSVKANKKSLYKVNVTELALQIGRTRTWTSLVLNGKEKSPATRKLIAEALGIDERILWPNGHNNNHRRAA